MILSKKRIIKALNKLGEWAGWSAPLLFANPEDRFSRVEAHMYHNKYAADSQYLKSYEINDLTLNYQTFEFTEAGQ